MNVQLNGGLLASRNGIIHASANEDPPDVLVRGVDEQMADGGLPLPIGQQFLDRQWKEKLWILCGVGWGGKGG